MTKVAILGATGYTAVELIKLLLRHPEVEIVAVTSRQEGNAPVAMVHPSLIGRLDLPLENLSPAEVAARADCAFSCLPHGASWQVVSQLASADCRVVDFSADYRLTDAEAYSRWYGQKHGDAQRLGTVAYGLPELYREQIKGSHLVANPGCYPTGAVLALAPLLVAQLIEPRDLIVDSKSGVSGAGRTPKMTTHFPECNESLSAYNVGRHRHTPEIEQLLRDKAGEPVRLVFTPHLVPMDRGILTTTYARPTRALDEEEVLGCLRAFYAEEPFVRVVDHLPATKDTYGTNMCHVTARLVGDWVVTISCIDNLVKGASGAAVQNFNLMYGYPETAALL